MDNSPWVVDTLRVACVMKPTKTPAACFCGRAATLEPRQLGTGIDAWVCPCCGYMKTPSATGEDDRVQVQEQHPGAFQGVDGRRFGSVIGRIRAVCALFRVRHALFGGQGPVRILDFGCGQGYFLDALRTQGHACVGVEISAVTGRMAAAKGHHVLTTLDTLADASFTAVASVHVIEHLPDPAAVLAALRRVLMPGARFYFEVPNYASWQAGLFRARWLHCEPGLHVHHFTLPSLRGLLEPQGYRVLRVGTYSFEHGLLGWVQSLYNLVFPYNRFFRHVILNRPWQEKMRCWPEFLLFPLTLAAGLVLFLCEAAAGRGAVLRVEGEVSAAQARQT